eukprot:CAMPEP_0174272916 /NCGR_PEP_ID=MMETSP0439-20130205/52760_1 /TAXON_ID=0 /ORGANISM="Stereomyxa ramosa, Strain Chinc5" /LENGTH=59 /DNA_ID=CAMNT_0015363737 /DNA_START=806 /DNA_END=982 /DNA_ORIENTATION=+
MMLPCGVPSLLDMCCGLVLKLSLGQEKKQVDKILGVLPMEISTKMELEGTVCDACLETQ